MATLLLQTAGSTIGSAIGGSAGAILGRAAGTFVGQALTQSLNGSGRAIEGPQLETLAMLASNEGAPIPRLYGRVRIGGQVIWTTRFIETKTVERSGRSGSKSLRSSGSKTTTYSYAGNFAIGLCEGEIAFVRRIWADGRELDQSGLTIRIHRGSRDQAADPLIIAKEGADRAPAYRGLAYAVFENFPLTDYGNRIPQLSFEIVRPVAGLCDMIRAVDLIPGSSEYAYGVRARVQNYGGVSISENRHQLFGESDWTASLDALQALCPNLRHVALIVSWFGDDMRAGFCNVQPRVENRSKNIVGESWSVASWTRGNAPLVSEIEGRPAYGGTPSDASVREAIIDLKARGLSVLFYPFLMMDVPFDNVLPEPRQNKMGQKAYGWRGDILPSAADGTAAARAEVEQFFARWRICILHYAQLCREVGGVAAFLVGSEFRALTQTRDESALFPAAQQLLSLAQAARERLGSATKISYAADWNEYGALSRAGGQDVRFPLDPFWASPDVDFIGIDCYFPLSDWRHRPGHADADQGRSIYDRTYLANEVAGGEAYDFYYADDAARAAQSRAPIADGASNKPWVFRAKDLVNWWSQVHFEREAGREKQAPTQWRPGLKPIWLTEFGCPAVDLGANTPHIFPDTKIARQLPLTSSGARDDLIQIRAIETFLAHFDPQGANFNPAHNPVSALYSGRMVDPERIYLWAWDARPFPAFPMLTDVWSDGANWDTGHWLNGRLESVPIDRLVVSLIEDLAGESIELPPLDGIADGYAIDRPMSARGALDPLCAFFAFDAICSPEGLRFTQRSDGEALDLGPEDLVPRRDGALVSMTRAEDSSLPHELALGYTESEWDYRPALVSSRRLEGATRRVVEGELALVTHAAVAQAASDVLLQDLWVARETVQVSLRPGLRQLEPGDLVQLPISTGRRLFRITRLTDGSAREIEARAVDRDLLRPAPQRLARRPAVTAPRLPGPPRIEILDLAVARQEEAVLQYAAAFADPWPGALTIWRSESGAHFESIGEISLPAVMGETLDDLPPGPTDRFDRAHAIRVVLAGGALVSASQSDVLAGRNLLALRGADGQWELLGFMNAELIGERTYRLSHFLRGLGGQDDLAARTAPAGSTFVLVDEALVPLATGARELGLRRILRIGPALRDYGDASYVEFEATPGDLALRPLSPVHVRARRTPEGIAISFLRRARLDADGWEGLDPPLGEAMEAYQIDIMNGAVVKRSLFSTMPAVLYTTQNELADFGVTIDRLSLRLSQNSAIAGRGFFRETNIPVL